MKSLTSGCFFLLLAAMAASHYGRAQSAAAAQTTKEVEMTAKKYEFSPGTVDVQAGTKIIFKIKALDREHGFEIENVKDSCVKIKKEKPPLSNIWRKSPERLSSGAVRSVASVTAR